MSGVKPLFSGKYKAIESWVYAPQLVSLILYLLNIGAYNPLVDTD